MANLNFSWLEMCGPDGLVPWYPTRHDIGICFQHIFLEVPVLFVFAVTSAFYYGNMSHRRSNSRRARWTIRVRFLASLLIAMLPIVHQVLIMKVIHTNPQPADILESGVKIIAWVVHSGYVLTLRHQPNVNGPVLCRVLWTLTAALDAINVRSQALANQTSNHSVTGLNIKVSIALLVLEFVYGLTFIPSLRKSESTLFDNHTQFSEHSHLLSTSQMFREDFDPDYLGVAMDKATPLSKLFFYWVNPLIKKGVDKKLRTSDDLFDLPTNLTTCVLCTRLQSLITPEPKPLNPEDVTFATHPKSTLFRALHMSFGFQFYSIGILKFGADVLAFAGPVLLNRLIQFLDDAEEPISHGYFYASALFLTSLVKAFLIVHFNFFMARLSLKLRGALISNVYRKVLVSSWSTVHAFTIGELINFVSTDTDRIVNSCASFHSFWSIPFQLGVTFYLLYEQIGISFLAGVAFTVLLIPVNKFIASKIGDLTTKMMSAKDERVAAVTEVLRSARTIKFHAWEEYFLERVLRIRREELEYLRGRKYLDAMCVYFWAATPIAISVLTFATYHLAGNQLKPASVFTALALLNMLIAPLNAFPWILNGLTEAWVSVKRLQRFFHASDSNLREYYRGESSSRDGGLAFTLENCTFDWFTPESDMKKSDRVEGESEARCFSLKDVTLEVRTGSLVAVAGPVGSGKSSLVAALLGEMNKVDGTITMSNLEGGCALVTQTPWLQRGTLRENILFGKNYDDAWYKTVVNACCLDRDLDSFRNGDCVFVGDEGMTLSAGQRARVALARAVYQNKDIYLLDDVLAAVDAQVARHLYNKVICGLLKEKTRIFCTNQPLFLTNADVVILLNGGTVCATGKPLDVSPELDVFNFDLDVLPGKAEVKGSNNFPSITPCEDAEEEPHETDAVNFKVWKKYWTSMEDHFAGIMILVAFVGMQTSRIMTDYLLSEWVSSESKINATGVDSSVNATRSGYLIDYIVLAVLNTLLTLCRAFLFAYGGLRAATKIYEKLLRRVVWSKVTFFDINPVGRVLNRFSSDTYTIDESLPFILNIFLAQLFGLIGALVITVNGNPWLFLVLAPLVPVYTYLQNSYRHASRELKRLSTLTLSPLYSHINETLQGLVVIRSFRCLPRFMGTNQEYLENSQKTLFASEAATQWLNLRLQLIGVVIVTAVGFASILQHEFDVVNAAVVGLSVSYALSITASLNSVVTAFTETEREMISMERVGQYIDEIQSEVGSPESGAESERSSLCPPPFGWPSHGVIVFEGVYLKYREHLIPSLNGVSFETLPSEKIGVVGRTGAGKSTLIVALLRLVEASNGRITIDGVNIRSLTLLELRTRIAVIPSEPFLFEGTIRENLDPLGEHTDAELHTALNKCYAWDLVERCGSLDGKITGGGATFSRGEKQLLCLARAVLRNAKIVCLDEATASVDPETDRKIQQTIRSCFRLSTVLTIAHRISTIMDNDRVLVLRDGEIVEFNSPNVLALDKTSYFYRLRREESQ